VPHGRCSGFCSRGTIPTKAWGKGGGVTGVADEGEEEDQLLTEMQTFSPAGGSTPPRAESLLVMSKTGVFTRPLPKKGEISLGRSPTCDIHVDDAKVSRVHAKLRIRQRFELVDLGSRNGTLVGDRRLAPNVYTPVDIGDMITLGSTVLILQTTLADAPPIRLWSQSTFEERVEEERRRAESTRSSFAIVQVKYDVKSLLDPGAATTARDDISRDAAQLERLERTLREFLRPTDVVSSRDGAFEVLLPATPPETADALGAQLSARLKKLLAPFVVGVACYPRDGHNRESLERQAEVLHPRVTDEPPAKLDRGVMKTLAPMIEKVAAGAINVLILGETGVGKEVMARTIHERSPRRSGPMLALNCAAFSEQLLESELFGYEKGAFTGATQTKQGLLEAAGGGTVFLDEVGEMPLGLQAKLLRVLEQREVMRVGALKTRPIDVRFIFATNRDLHVEIAAGRFRSDLFFRINGISLTIPPLRERVDEIESLARMFVQQAAEQSRRPPPPIAPQVLELLRRYRWPGNIRELRNVMERAVLLSHDVIALEHIPSAQMGPVVPLGNSARARPPDIDDEHTIAVPPARSDDELDSSDGDERRRIIAALEQCAGNQTKAAKLLGISRRTLVTRLEEYALPRPRKK